MIGGVIRGVYGIVDVTPARPPAAATQLAKELLAGGVRILQLRAKELPARATLALARELRALTEQAGALFVINDRADLAVLAGADAVHLGQDDLPAGAVRSWLPERIGIGVSCHSPAQVAAVEHADYIGYGPIFGTLSKARPDPVVGLESLAAIKAAHPDLPVVAIGGIALDRLREVKRTGADAAAMISALDGIEAARRAVAIWEER